MDFTFSPIDNGRSVTVQVGDTVSVDFAGVDLTEAATSDSDVLKWLYGGGGVGSPGGERFVDVTFLARAPGRAEVFATRGGDNVCPGPPKSESEPACPVRWTMHVEVSAP